MYDSAPYRPCPVCRTNMKAKADMPTSTFEGQTWHIYECYNCTSEVWINPFKRIRQQQQKKKSWNPLSRG